ncbi:hypothetical protein FSP39_002680 [Pinctada imbricata]|uniref:Inter-alpha-trypsin inhibitor heavy chain H3-like n=1 Tax=Pinctada imbricata TaxID=66713 RepID=A0AA88YH78_PINIB|nr:hypothetical protein FSP39_002680 [Pinctada imbricata]
MDARETTFDVTLPDAAFISNFTLEIDGQLYPGQVQEKEAARQKYEKARQKGHTAGHIGTRPRDTNRFLVSIHVAALSEVTFTLHYNELLQRRRGTYEHTIYINPGQVVNNLLVEVTIQEFKPITHLHVPPLRKDILYNFQNNIWNTYAIVQRPSSTSAYIRYNPSVADQQRASLQGLSGLFIVEYDIDRNKDGGEILIVNGYFVHYFSPSGLQRMPRQIVFILDSSGSMTGTKIDQLKSAMKEILSNLNPDDSFNILQFADTNIEAAIIEGLRIFQKSNTTRTSSSLIIFLTDGEPTEGETDTSKILGNIDKENGASIPIFSLSFGEDADYHFLRKMSAQNNAFVRKIYEASDASLQLTGFYKEIAATLMANLTFHYLDDRVIENSITNVIYPSYFEGSELVISGQVTDNSINSLDYLIKGVGSDGPLEFKPSNNIVQKVGAEVVPSNFSEVTEKIWAYMSIKHMLIERLKTHNQTAKNLLTEKATQLAIKYNFVTPLTSMIVTKPEEDKVVDPNEDYEMNDSPHSVWDNALTGSLGLALAGRAPSYVDSDPHFIIRVKGLETSVCFDVMGTDGDVFNLVRDEISGIVVDATVAAATTRQRRGANHMQPRIDGASVDQGNQSNNETEVKVKTYLGSVLISGSRTMLEITPQQWKINGRVYKWKASQAVSSYKTKIVTDGTGKMIAIMFPHRITLLVVRHMRSKSQLRMGKIHFLGFYIVDDRGFSWHTHGLLGQFIYRRISLIKRKNIRGGKIRGKLKVEGNTRKSRKVVATLGKRLNLATNQHVSCWMVQKNGKRLLDGNYSDYIIRSKNVTISPRKFKRRRHVVH